MQASTGMAWESHCIPESCVLPWAGHMADKIVLPLTSGISGMLQGAERLGHQQNVTAINGVAAYQLQKQHAGKSTATQNKILMSKISISHVRHQELH